jgi:hypothetical protein
LRIGPGLQQQCDWDATAVTVHVFWVSRVFNIQRQTWRARMSTPERQQMQRSIDCEFVMSLLQRIPEKYHDHDDVHIKLAQCTARKESKSISKLEYFGYICKIIRSKLISFEFSS